MKWARCTGPQDPVSHCAPQVNGYSVTSLSLDHICFGGRAPTLQSQHDGLRWACAGSRQGSFLEVEQQASPVGPKSGHSDSFPITGAQGVTSGDVLLCTCLCVCHSS